MAKAKTVGRNFMARPASQAALPRMQMWRVLREDVETGAVEEFLVECVEGMFFKHYRNLGLIDGNTLFDPYVDMDEGRMMRELIATY